ncbi:hypothetical protein P4O66_008801 [Electrophorus voltai]|uniref:Reverse transcriptase domain-containing protein n=1 Tax=Electrophorus voltai TaxID=2609070 RepID=A0AAD9DVW9_9TELE|nr:hypothetical protein P4O66_008801 [Electrophorus voltai]
MQVFRRISACLTDIGSWMTAHHLKLNPSKTELLFIPGFMDDKHGDYFLSWLQDGGMNSHLLSGQQSPLSLQTQAEDPSICRIFKGQLTLLPY